VIENKQLLGERIYIETFNTKPHTNSESLAHPASTSLLRGHSHTKIEFWPEAIDREIQSCSMHTRIHSHESCIMEYSYV